MNGRKTTAVVLMVLGVAGGVLGSLASPSRVSAAPVVAVRGVSPDATADNGQQKLARGDDGTLYLAYTAPVEGVEQAHISFSLDGGQTWKPEIALGQPGVWSDLPAIAAGAGGRLDAAWVDYSSVGHVWYSRMEDRQWTEPLKISPGEHYAGFPALAVLGGDAHVLWYGAPPAPDREHGSAYEIRHSFASGANWSEPELLSSNSEDALNPSLTVAPDGALHAAWFQIVSATYGAQHAAFEDGSWALPAELVSALEQTATGVSIVSGADGSLHLVWEQASGTDVGVAYSAKQEGGWSPARMLSQSLSQDPVVALDSNLTTVVLWSEDGRIKASTSRAWDSISDLGPGTNPTLLSGDRTLAAWTRPAAASHEVVATYLNLDVRQGELRIPFIVSGLALALVGAALWISGRERESGGDAGDG